MLFLTFLGSAERHGHSFYPIWINFLVDVLPPKSKQYDILISSDTLSCSRLKEYEMVQPGSLAFYMGIGEDVTLSDVIMVFFSFLSMYFLWDLFVKGWLVSSGIQVILGLWSTCHYLIPPLLATTEIKSFSTLYPSVPNIHYSLY